MTIAMSGWQQLSGCASLRHDDVAEPVSWLPLPARGHPACRWLYHCFGLRDVELIAASAAGSTIFGGRSTRTELSSTSWSKPSRRHRDQAILPQAAERPVISSAGDRDSQAQELRRRQARDSSKRRAPSKPISQQSRRGVAPADTTRTTNEAHQVVMRSPFSLPTAGSATTSRSNRHRLSANQTLYHPRCRVSHMARGRRCPRLPADVALCCHQLQRLHRRGQTNGRPSLEQRKHCHGTSTVAVHVPGVVPLSDHVRPVDP